MVGRIWVSFFLLPGLYAADVSVQRATARPETNACAARAEGFLEGRLAFWQQRLNLSDWKVSVVMSASSDLKPKTLGNIHWDSVKKVAVIRVLRASAYKLACQAAIDDMELTVVHELVHLELSSLPRNMSSRREEEHAVNRITGALLGLDRQRNVGDPGPASPDQPVTGN